MRPAPVSGSGFGDSPAAISGPLTTVTITAQLGNYHDNTYGSTVVRQWEWRAVARVLDQSTQQFFSWQFIYQPVNPDNDAQSGIQSSQTNNPNPNTTVIDPAIEINNNLYAQPGAIVSITPGGLITQGPPISQEYTFTLQSPGAVVIGQLTQDLHTGDSYASMKYYRLDGSWSPSIQALNTLGLQGANTTLVVAIPNTAPGTAASNPYVVIAVQPFAQNVVGSVVWDFGTGNLDTYSLQVPTSGPGITSNASPLSMPVIVTTAVDAGTDLQRDTTLTSAPVLSPSSPTFGGPVTITSQVTHASGVADPTGYISFVESGSNKLVGTSVTLDSSGNGVLTTTADQLPDSGTLVGYYNGDSSYAQSTSAGASYSLTAAVATVVLTCAEASNPTTNITTATYGDSLILTASVAVTSTNASLPIAGLIQWMDGITVLGSSTVLGLGAAAQATLTWNLFNSAVHALTATFLPTDTAQIAAGANGTLNLTVNPALLTITTDDQTMIYGSAVPALTTTITGFQLSDTVAVISGTFGVTTTATSSQPIGSYPVTAVTGTATAANYNFSFVNTGAVTINQAPLSVTAQDVSIPAKSAMPAASCNDWRHPE